MSLPRGPIRLSSKGQVTAALRFSSQRRRLDLMVSGGNPVAMCNNYVNDLPYDAYREAFAELRIPVVFPEAAPNLAPQPDIRPTDVAPVIRLDEGRTEFARLSWGFPPGRPKAGPIINYRSEGRRVERGRCLVPASAFHEYTGARYPKTKWRFARADEMWMGIAGLWRPTEMGGAFTMLTVEPGPDVAPYHDRQIVILERRDWATWLDPAASVSHLMGPSPSGLLTVRMAVSGSGDTSPGLDLGPTGSRSSGPA